MGVYGIRMGVTYSLGADWNGPMDLNVLQLLGVSAIFSTVAFSIAVACQ